MVRRFSFPPQEHRFDDGDTAFDAETNRSWTVRAVDNAAGTIDLKMGNGYDGPLPAAPVEGGPVPTTQLRERLRNLGARVVRDGAGGRDAALSLLGPGRPRRAGRCGPRARRRPGPRCGWRPRCAARTCRCRDRRGRGRPTPPPGRSSSWPGRALRDGELDLAAGTAWLWARPGLAGSVDTLFVDEAGQLSLANVLAVAGAARNLVLLGDPQQLAQPSQATHPPGAGASALEHILGGRATMPEGAGLLLDQTYRMHPDLCRYTSETFYDGKLHGVDGLRRQEILGWASGLCLVEVPHQGNTSASPEEAREVARLAAQLTGRTWHDKYGTERSMEPTDILIVTPYNAQIRAIEKALSANGQTGFRVGTVDKFQGREAPVVIYSMATSSADEAPRGLDFLYDPHRLNVATSRARALAIIVASPDLIRVSCRTPHQMVLANALCRAWEERSRRVT